MNNNIIAPIVKAAEILQLFKDKDEWSIAEIGRALNLSVSSVHRLVLLLKSVRVVYKNQNEPVSEYYQGCSCFSSI